MIDYCSRLLVKLVADLEPELGLPASSLLCFKVLFSGKGRHELGLQWGQGQARANLAKFLHFTRLSFGELLTL